MQSGDRKQSVSQNGCPGTFCSSDRQFKIGQRCMVASRPTHLPPVASESTRQAVEPPHAPQSDDYCRVVLAARVGRMWVMNL